MTFPAKPLTKEEIAEYRRLLVNDDEWAQEGIAGINILFDMALAHLEMVESVRGRLAEIECGIAQGAIGTPELEVYKRALSWVLGIEPPKGGEKCGIGEHCDRESCPCDRKAKP